MTNKAVIFDVGRVLIEWDMRLPFRHMMNDAEIGRFLAETELPAWNLKFDAGHSFTTGINELCARFPHYAEALRTFDTDWIATTPSAISGSVAILEKLKAQGTPVFAITNFSAEKWPLACARYPFLSNSFVDVAVSAHEGIIKPDAEIFNRLISRNNLEHENCIFIDDSPKNVAGAIAVGIDGILFTSPEHLKQDLIARSILSQEAVA